MHGHKRKGTHTDGAQGVRHCTKDWWLRYDILQPPAWQRVAGACWSIWRRVSRCAISEVQVLLDLDVRVAGGDSSSQPCRCRHHRGRFNQQLSLYVYRHCRRTSAGVPCARPKCVRMKLLRRYGGYAAAGSASSQLWWGSCNWQGLHI